MLASLKALTAVAAVVGGGAFVAAHSGSVGNVSVTGPVCVRHTVHPGDTVTAVANVVNGSGATAKVDVSTDPVVGQPLMSFPPGGHPIYKQFRHPPGKTWAEVGGPYTIPAGTTVQATVTVHIPPGAPKGQYGTFVYAHSYGHPSGSGNQVALGGGDGAYFAMSVGVPPPPHCGGQQDWPWKSDWTPPLPVCKSGQAPLRGQQAACRVLPLQPPAVSANNCHWTKWHWDRYMGQLIAGGKRYYHNPRALLKDAHCVVDGRVLNGAAFYRGTGMYRYADNGQAGPVTGGRWSGARPANNPDNWRTSGSS